MAQFVVRNLEEDVAEKLKNRAKRHARSMEDEVRHILRAAVQERPEGMQKLGTRIAQRFPALVADQRPPGEHRGDRAGCAEQQDRRPATSGATSP